MFDIKNIIVRFQDGEGEINYRAEGFDVEINKVTNGYVFFVNPYTGDKEVHRYHDVEGDSIILNGLS